MSENHMVTSDKHADQVLKRNISVYKKPAGLHIDEWSWVIQGRLSSRNHSACPWGGCLKPHPLFPHRRPKSTWITVMVRRDLVPPRVNLRFCDAYLLLN